PRTRAGLPSRPRRLQPIARPLVQDRPRREGRGGDGRVQEAGRPRRRRHPVRHGARRSRDAWSGDDTGDGRPAPAHGAVRARAERAARRPSRRSVNSAARAHMPTFSARGSGLVLLARYVLDGLGLDQERDFQAVYLDRAGDGPAMVLDGRVAALWGGGVGWPGFTAVAKAPGGARFIVPDAQGLKKI